MSFIDLSNVTKAYVQNGFPVYALNAVSTEIQEGEICVILGPSGSGKSTLLNVIGGLDTIDSGTIVVNDSTIGHMNRKELAQYRRANLSFVFQFYNLIPNLTVEENVRTCEYLAEEPLDYIELLQVLGIEEQRRKFPSQLSGGQQQRCSIARALVKNPKLLLCDEPTGALDSKTSKEILRFIEKINHIYNTTICIVTHNTAIKDMAHKVIYLKDGKIASSYMNKERKSVDEIDF